MKKTKQNPPVLCRTEYAEQCAIFRLAQLHSRQYQELLFMQGSLSGVKLSIGAAMKAKKAGCLRKGIADLFLPVRRNGYSGLFLELKRVKGSKILPEQVTFAAFVTNQGYMHRFAYGCDEAWKIIMDYLNS